MQPSDVDEGIRGLDVASCRLIHFVTPMHDENNSKSNMPIALNDVVIDRYSR